MSRRRYAIVCPDLHQGGAVANVALNHARLLSEVAEVTLVSSGFPEGLPESIQTVPCATEQFYWLRRFGHAPREIAFARGALRRLQAIVDADGLDAVMCHGHVVGALCAARLKATRSVPYALVTHGDIFDRPKGTYDRWLTALYRRTTPPAYRQADLILALSPRMKELAERWAGSATRIEVVPNGIDLDEISASANEAIDLFDGDGLKVLYVGRLSVEKGVKYLVDAMARLESKEIPAQLRLVGDGPLRGELEAQVESLGLRSVRFIGRRSRQELGACYLAADLVCIPSLSDPLPTVVLETMAAGRPVVGSRVGGIPFMVEDGRTGIVVEPKCSEAIADALELLATYPDKRVEQGAAAVLRARNEFSWGVIADRMARLLDELH